MKPADSHTDVDCQAHEEVHLERHAEQSLERLAAGILEHQHGPAALTNQLAWTFPVLAQSNSDSSINSCVEAAASLVAISSLPCDPKLHSSADRTLLSCQKQAATLSTLG